MSIRHDYKSAAAGQRRQRARRYGLLVMTLVLIGLFSGLLAYIKGDRIPPAPATVAVTPSAPAQPPSTPAEPPKAVVAPLAEPEPVKPKYDFYTELPKRKIAIQRESIKPGNAPQPAPARMQPAVDRLHKPGAPRGNAKSPTQTMTTASSSKPDSRITNSKPANSKPANSKPANSETVHAKTTNSKPATTKTVNSEPMYSKSTATNSRTATAKPTTGAPASPTNPARTAQPPRPLANNNSRIVVKTEQAP